ncbi:MAG: short chain dehydrogenase [Robiginitomaculum sp.]|nr:MAG: short chain dehydrogenase [Robiginitomaculum sp.]
MRNLNSKTALVTGASGGLGRSLCLHLAAAGVNIIAFDKDEKALERLERDLRATPISFKTVVGDITLDAGIAAVKQVVESEFGRLDMLIHNAGVTHFSQFSDSGASVTRRVMDINFMGAVVLTDAVLPLIRKSHGSIVAMSSVAGFAPLFARTGYSASKHAMHGFFESLRGELLDDDVHVMMVCPSFIDTQVRMSKEEVSKDPHLSRPGSATETTGTPMTSDFVAGKILQGIVRRKPQLVIGKVAKLSWIISRISPRFYEKKMIQSTKQEGTTNGGFV